MIERTKLLLGEAGVDKLANSSVLIVGVGGVGGYVAEMLARASIGKLTLVDGDCVEESNLNRQIIALKSTIGKPKVEVFLKRIKDINPNCQVRAIFDRFSVATAASILQQSKIEHECKHQNNVENIEKIVPKKCEYLQQNEWDKNLEKYDFVVDAIDSFADKVELICSAGEMDLPIVSAMGAGNRWEMPSFCIVDIYKTTYDKLAKKLRGELKKRGVKSLAVCVDNSPTAKLIDDNCGLNCEAESLATLSLDKEEKCESLELQSREKNRKKIGSISYAPAISGCMIAAFVINQLLTK